MKSKRILINESEINYSVSVSKKAKNLRIEISPQKGVLLIVPDGISLKDAEKFLNQKKSWILKHYAKIASKKEEFLFLGSKMKLKQKFDSGIKMHQIEVVDSVINIKSPVSSKLSTEEIYERWLKLKAEKFIPLKAKKFADRYGFKYNRITIRGQKTRWGSCSAKNNLSFNYRLMRLPEEIIDYVIIHELCHLKELNHSDRFWKLVKEILPNYKFLRSELKQMG